MKKVEFLFPELTSNFGEFQNMEYFKKCSSEIEVIETNNKKVPYFVSNKVDMIYLGSMTERCQEKIIVLLKPYKERIKELIDSGVIFLATGNAFEIFGSFIKDEDKKIECLNIFDYYSIRNMKERHNSQFVGTFKNMEIVGHRSNFSCCYSNSNSFINITHGVGMNPKTNNEGINVNNFYGTYSLGPFLILNPYFTKYLLKLLNLKDELPFEKTSIDAYNIRKEHLKEIS